MDPCMCAHAHTHTTCAAQPHPPSAAVHTSAGCGAPSACASCAKPCPERDASSGCAAGEDRMEVLPWRRGRATPLLEEGCNGGWCPLPAAAVGVLG
eukprot:1159398-Pelagomonas_calceolata.AAC.9